MKTEDAIKFYGSAAKLAKVLGISRQAVDNWGDTVPRGRAYELMVITGGRIRTNYHKELEK